MVITLFFVIVIVLFSLPSFIHTGSFGEDDPSGVPGHWYVGTTPSYESPSKYPILFVHGINSSSNTWWDENNMYDTAYQNGYKTAFIDLYPTKNMWDNGKLLAKKIREIYDHFGEKVVIVAHSKGGIDTQSALVHYGAYPYVERVITLSTPHSGSQLADLAYSSWAGWITDIIGRKNDAIYSLQTGYMNYFRSKTDKHANVYKNHYYTFCGTKWGSFGSSLYWGGLYLSSFDSNDGAVTVSSSKLPNSTQLKVGDWNHSTIKQGSTTFKLFKDYLNDHIYSSASIQSQAIVAPSPNEHLGTFIRGGEFKGKQRESIFVEGEVNEITIDWISGMSTTELTLNDPTNKEYSSFTIEKDETGYFGSGYHHLLTINNPVSGEWKLEANSLLNEHYLLNVSFDSPLNESIGVNLTDDEVRLKTKDSKFQKTDMMIDYYNEGKLKKEKIMVQKDSDLTYKLPKVGEGVYNITIDINGYQDKEKFQRTFIKTVYVDKEGNVFSN